MSKLPVRFADFLRSLICCATVCGQPAAKDLLTASHLIPGTGSETYIKLFKSGSGLIFPKNGRRRPVNNPPEDILPLGMA